MYLLKMLQNHLRIDILKDLLLKAPTLLSILYHRFYYQKYMLLFYQWLLQSSLLIFWLETHKAALTAPSAPIELRDIYENVVERHGRPEDFLVENSDFDCKASVIAYAMNNETILCAGQDIFDGMLGSKETDAENCSCVSVSDKEFARLHSKFGLKKEDVLEAIKAYAQELGLEYGPVNYFMMCDPKYANDLGEVVQ